MAERAANYIHNDSVKERIATGFALVNWCGDVTCEDKIKDDLGLKSRCMPEGLTDPDGACVVCGKEAVTKIYFGKQY